MKLLTIYILVIITLTSYGQTRDPYSNENKNGLNSFKTFIGRFKVLSFPFIAKTDCYNPDSLISVPLNMDNDSGFIDYVGPAVTIGLFPDTTNFYAVFYCTASFCYLPTIAVFTKDGKRLSKEQISNACGSGVGYICSDSLTISSMTDIRQQLIEETFNVDKNGIEIPNSWKKEITINNFSIDKFGLINKKEEKKK